MKQLSKSQIICIVLLWIALCVMLVVSAKEINWETIFTMVASGVIILIGVTKNNGRSNKFRRK